MRGPASSRRDDATTVTNAGAESAASNEGSAPALVVCWSREEPHRAGELAFAPANGSVAVLGRGLGTGDERRLEFRPHSPKQALDAQALQGRGISRSQLRVERAGERLRVENVGRCKLEHNGALVTAAELQAGDTLQLERQVLLVCVARAPAVPSPRFFPEHALGAFGRADAVGLIGESAQLWALRDRAAFCAIAEEHVLVHGPSGTGKELVARAVHQLSQRRSAALMARNASTIPSGIASAELFGNRRDYPNVGMPERAGLVGEAESSTLFLDELGELSPELQSQLLRFLDSGEYQRLGDGRPRRGDARVVAATNRDPGELKHDLFARLKLRIAVPDLNVRREDVPLLARELVARAARRSPRLVQRFVRDSARGAEIYVSARLMDRLVRHRYILHVRELDALLWQAMADSSGDELDLSEGVEQRLSGDGDGGVGGDVEAETITPEQIRMALATARGNKTDAARRLGLSSRFALYRLMKRVGVDAE